MVMSRMGDHFSITQNPKMTLTLRTIPEMSSPAEMTKLNTNDEPTFLITLDALLKSPLSRMKLAINRATPTPIQINDVIL